MNFIMNERELVEKLLNNPVFDKTVNDVLGRIAVYYKDNGFDKKYIERMLELYILRCDPQASILKWQDVIDSAIRRSGKRELIELDSISITKSEMAKIKELSGSTRQKVMFSLVCIAKYHNAIHSNNNNWVNSSMAEIFSASNVSAPQKSQASYLNDFIRLGYISTSRVVDNTNLNVKIIDDSSEEELSLTDMRNLGNQYMWYCGGKYFKCNECGAVIKRMSNSQKCCKKCSYIAHLNKLKELYHACA